MKIILLHISDIHIKSTNESLIKKAKAIYSAVQTQFHDAKYCFIIVTGDIAFSGKRNEYEVAFQFFEQLQSYIEDNHNISTNCVFIPGNHDCNFSYDDEVRQLTLNSVIKDHSNIGDSIINECIKIQRDYFQFRDTFCANELDNSKQRLFNRRKFEINGGSILFNCFNTAWLSRKDEQQGTLIFPLHILEDYNYSQHILIISLFHHPYNWIQADNARQFKLYIQKNSDIILTGHEHAVSHSINKEHSGEINEYIEGACFQSEQGKLGKFNVIAINLSKSEHSLYQYHWEKDHFKRNTLIENIKFQRSQLLGTKIFSNNVTYNNELLDPGANYSHPKAINITLRDIFVYPDLEERPAVKKPNKVILPVIRSENVPEYILKIKRIIIIGTDRAGKTSLAKMIYLHLLENDIVPLLIPGNKLKASTFDNFSNTIELFFKNQYNEDNIDKYRQIDKSKKALIIDDFNSISINEKTKLRIIDYAEHIFGRIIIFTDELFPIEEISLKTQEREIYAKFEVCTIKEFGHFNRKKLIKNWYKIGLPHNENEVEIEHKVALTEKILNTIRGKNLIPAYPIFILMIIQTIEAERQQDTSAGAYGYLYEMLINLAISNISKDISMDTKITFLSKIAFFLYRQNSEFANYAELEEVYNDYFENYKVRINLDSFVQNSVNYHILKPINGGYKFKYKYIYYYFVAKFFQENIKINKMRIELIDDIKKMASKLYVEDFANILIFLIYLSKDEFIINEMIKNSTKLFSDIEPCDFEKHVDFINKLQSKEVKLVMEDKNPDEKRDELLMALDDVDREDQNNKEMADRQKQEEQDILNLNIAFKTIQIMGQILCNFPGSLPAQTKHKLALESYKLGLRTLNVFFSIFDSNFPEFKSFINDEFLKDEKLDKHEREIRVDMIIFYISLILGLIILKKISISVGSEKLEQTFKDILKEQNSLSFKLIDISIKLDHFVEIPLKEVINLYENLKGNIFAATTLRYLVLSRINFFRTPYKTEQTLREKLNISLEKPKLLMDKRRK